jgi:hypothetical protein
VIEAGELTQPALAAPARAPIGGTICGLLGVGGGIVAVRMLLRTMSL